jgi:superoxide dismutase, Cu-Zn family
MRRESAWTGRIDTIGRLAGCALLAAGILFGGCKKGEDAAVLDEGEIAVATPAMEATPAPTVTNDIAGAQLSGPDGAKGVVTFTQEAGGVHVVARVEGVKPGRHGFHLHAGTACDGDFTSAGDHFNPGNQTHGGNSAPPRHAGDFGNIEVGADGVGNVDFTAADLSIGGGAPNDVLGQALILHAGEDDLKSQPSGNSGARIACGLVQRAQGEAVTGAAPDPNATATIESAPQPGREY